MIRMAPIILALSVFLLAGAIAPDGAAAQLRGGPPVGLPAGGPFGVGGPDLRDVAHGPPPWSGVVSGQLPPGLERARAVVPEKLSLPQKERASNLARTRPDSYELDRAGALVVRGQVLATGLAEGQIAAIRQAGFSVDRQEDLPDLGLSMAIISRPGVGSDDLLRRLRRIAPRATFAPNHVLFGSGRPAAPVPAPFPPEPSAADSGRGARVGLIDAGVSARVDSPRVRIVRRAFLPGAEQAELHGTAVATLLAAPPGPVTIYAAGIFTETRAGSSDLLVRALGWLASERVPVINISMVGPPNPVVALAVAALVRKGFAIVAPVGNDGAAARPLFPASYPGVIAVSAAGNDGRLLPEASRVDRVDFVARGIDEVADPSGQQTTVRGTSFAAPVVSRRLAGLLSAPDPRAVQTAVGALARRARKFAGDRRWTGNGLIGAQ